MADSVDVCVVGSGAGGGAIAYVLAAAGVRVVVLEKGPWRERREFRHDELAEVRRDFYVPFVADEPHLLRSRVDEVAETTSFGWIAAGVGGGTVHYSGVTPRLGPDDFRRGTLADVADAALADWPLAYEEFALYYDRAEQLLGVSGEAGVSSDEPPRRTPFPLPALQAHPLAGKVEVAARALGRTAFPTPKAILSRAYRGRLACAYCDRCGSYGCEAGAKGSSAVAFLPPALATGRCSVMPGAMAKEVRTDRRGRAASVVYARGGELHEQKARVVVLACSAIETARLLLNSRSVAFPEGLANSSGLVGRHLMFLTLGRLAADFRFGGPAGEGLRDAQPFIGRALRVPAAGLVTFDFASTSPIDVAERLARFGERALWGRALKEKLRHHFRDGRHLEAETFSECLPVAANCVDVDETVCDRYGVPAARITFAHHPRDREASEKLVALARDLFVGMQADRVGDEQVGESYDVLQAGTCRFGTDPTRSVLDPSCRAHDVPNLYVADGSFLPTSGAAPFTLTIVANALRVGDTIARRLAAREL